MYIMVTLVNNVRGRRKALGLPPKCEGPPEFRLEASLGSQSRHHEQSTPSQAEEIYGQEVIIEIKWWQTCPRNIVGI